MKSGEARLFSEVTGIQQEATNISWNTINSSLTLGKEFYYESDQTLEQGLKKL